MRTIGGRYELCGVIASGGMATVHLARQSGAAGFARMVAVKQLHERFAREPEFVAMFLDEARLVARIRHANVVQTLDVVHERETSELFIVMEYVHGMPLHQVLLAARTKGMPVPPAIASAIMVGALHGLHEAHEARSETGEPLEIVHRDISPHNVLVGVDGAPRVLDFGVAKAQERVSSTNEGELKGKLSYMAPEQISDAGVSRRTDVYASCVVLWEMLAGRKLFTAANEGAILKQILEARLSAPGAFHPSVPAALDKVVMRGLDRDPAKRWATANELAEAIRASVPPASAGELSAWLRDLCADAIKERERSIAMIEAKNSRQNVAEMFDSLRAMGHVATERHPSGTGPKAPAASSATIKAAPTSVPVPPTLAAPTGLGLKGTLLMPPEPPRAAPSLKGTLLTPPGFAPRPAPPPLEPTATRIAVSRTPPKPPSSSAGLVIGGVVVLGVIVTAGAFAARYRGSPAPAPAPLVASASAAPAVAVAVPATSLTCAAGMVRVEGGSFFMGSDDGLKDEKPAHHVKLGAFCIDRLEVTADLYRACSERGDCKRASVVNRFDGITDRDHKVYDKLCTGADATRGGYPINCIDWSMADRFCRAEGKRLPTEAEWEFAARGSDGRKYPWGDKPAGPKLLNACGRECESWFKTAGLPSDGTLYKADDGFATLAPVGSFPAGASRWGAEDMAGNVWEWVADWYGPYTGDDQTNPTGPHDGQSRAIRGGAWNGSSADWIRPTFRFHLDPDDRNHGIGFRCAKAL